MMADRTVHYETTLSRAALALLAGVSIGAMLVCGFVMAIELSESVPSYAASLEAAGDAFAGWAVGLSVLASIPWLILHRMRLRSCPVAAALGATLAFLIGVVIADGALMDAPKVVLGHAVAQDFFPAVCIGARKDAP